MVSMPNLTYGNFIYAVENGNFYATTGPEFQNLYIDEEKDNLVIDCTAVRHILVKGIHTLRACRIDAESDKLTHVEIPLAEIRKKEPFIRVEIITSDMHKAYSQPYWF